jgi:hypothetical protein
VPSATYPVDTTAAMYVRNDKPDHPSTTVDRADLGDAA